MYIYIYDLCDTQQIDPLKFCLKVLIKVIVSFYSSYLRVKSEFTVYEIIHRNSPADVLQCRRPDSFLHPECNRGYWSADDI